MEPVARIARALSRVGGAAALAVVLGAGAVGAGEVVVTDRVAPRPGETCAVCGTEVGPDDVVLIVRGRRVPLMRHMEDRFLADPARYFTELQPRGALFAENRASRALPGGWLAVGLWALSAVFFAGLASYTAVSRGLAPSRWFFAGLFGNVLGYAALLVVGGRGDTRAVPHGLGKVPATAAPARCERCGAEVHPSAVRCAACGAERTPAGESEVARAAAP